jgi:hypothetical protein
MGVQCETNGDHNEAVCWALVPGVMLKPGGALAVD